MLTRPSWPSAFWSVFSGRKALRGGSVVGARLKWLAEVVGVSGSADRGLDDGQHGACVALAQQRLRRDGARSFRRGIRPCRRRGRRRSSASALLSTTSPCRSQKPDGPSSRTCRRPEDVRSTPKTLTCRTGGPSSPRDAVPRTQDGGAHAPAAAAMSSAPTGLPSRGRTGSPSAASSTHPSRCSVRSRRLPRSESPTSSAPVSTAAPTTTPRNTAKLPRQW